MTEAASKLSPLDAQHRELGATMVDYAGWQMPIRYDSDTREHLAVRQRAGLFDLSHMGELEVTGAQAGEALNYALVGSFAALPIGRARYTMMVDGDGGIIDDLIVYRLDGERFLIVANASNAEVVEIELRKRLDGFGAEMKSVSDDYALLAVQGPLSERIVQALVPDSDKEKVAAAKYYTAVHVSIDTQPVLLARTGYTGEDGFELFVSAVVGPVLWEKILRIGTPEGLVPAGLSARDSLRLEAGMPLYGNELTREISPFEPGLDRVIAMDKESFVGRAALIDRTEKTPAKKLAGLVGAGRRAARHGDVIEDADGTVIGVVTSGLPSPTLGHPVAMAYLDPTVAATAGAQVFAVVRGKREPFTVVALPFYRRPR